MLKNVLKIVLNILTVGILFLLQIYVFNKLYIFGVRFNVILVYCVINAMLNTLKISAPVNLVIGILADVLLDNGKLQYMLIFVIIAIVLESLKLIYKQDSSMSVAIYSAAGIGTFQILTSIFNAISVGMIINVFAHIFFDIKVLALNIPLAYLMYEITVKMKDKLER